jgi:pilus assembly protein CpaE
VPLIVDHDSGAAETLKGALGGEATVLTSVDALRRHLETDMSEDCVVLGPGVDQATALRLAEDLRLTRPTLGVVLVRRRIDTGVLGDALRAGVREVVDARDLSGLTAAVRRTRILGRALRDNADVPGSLDEPGPRGRVLTVFSAKGGCGKTTVATNLAAVLADGGKRQVVLVDLDLAFGDVAIALQLFPSHTIADAIPLGDTLDAQGVAGLLTPHSPGLTTLVAPLEPGVASSIPAELVGRILDVLREQYDFVVVDTPPAFDDQVLAAFDRSDVIALLATLDIPAVKNLKLTLETMELLNYPPERYCVVMNRSDAKVGLALSDVEKTLGTKVVAQIPSSRDVPASTNRGVPLALEQPRHPVTLALAAFADEHLLPPVSAEGVSPQPARRDWRGLLRWRTRAT